MVLLFVASIGARTALLAAHGFGPVLLLFLATEVRAPDSAATPTPLRLGQPQPPAALTNAVCTTWPQVARAGDCVRTGVCAPAQVLAAPVGVLADAAVVAACRDGEYGKFRKWGAVGWGVMSTVAGAIIDSWGMRAAFAVHILLSAPCLLLAWGLHEHQAAQLRLARAGASAAQSLRAASRHKRVTSLEPVKVRAIC